MHAGSAHDASLPQRNGASTPAPPPPPASQPPHQRRATDQGAATPAAAPNVDLLIRDVTLALGEYDALAGAADPAIANEAQHVLSELARLKAAQPLVSEEQRMECWRAVVEARTAQKALVDGDGPVAEPQGPVSPVSATDLADAEILCRAFDEAEIKARRSLSGPGAFKKFAASRKARDAHFAKFGVANLGELRQLANQAPEVAPATPARALAEAAEAVAAAEAAWSLLESPSGGYPASPEMDGLRVRSFRLIGSIVPDEQLEPRLSELASGLVAIDTVVARLKYALQALGLPESSDPIATARAVTAGR